MPSRDACLSERAKELSDRDSSLLCIDLRPKSPPQATSLECLLKTLRPRMQIGASAGLQAGGYRRRRLCRGQLCEEVELSRLGSCSPYRCGPAASKQANALPRTAYSLT